MTAPLLAAIRSALPPGPSPYTKRSRGDDVYEGYIFSLAIAIARARGATVHFETNAGHTTTSLLFRSAPGQLYARDRPFTHAVIEFPGAPRLEAHVGVRVLGNSGVLHECDVLVLPATEAITSRRQRIAPRGSRCLIAIECKYYVATTLELGLARNFEGLHADLKAKCSIFVANLDSQSIRKYLASRRRDYEHNVSPGSYEVGALQGTIRKAFRDFVSGYSPSTRV